MMLPVLLGPTEVGKPLPHLSLRVQPGPGLNQANGVQGSRPSTEEGRQRRLRRTGNPQRDHHHHREPTTQVAAKRAIVGHWGRSGQPPPPAPAVGAPSRYGNSPTTTGDGGGTLPGPMTLTLTYIPPCTGSLSGGGLLQGLFVIDSMPTAARSACITARAARVPPPTAVGDPVTGLRRRRPWTMTHREIRLFAIDSSTQISVATGASIDYETDDTHRETE